VDLSQKQSQRIVVMENAVAGRTIVGRMVCNLEVERKRRWRNLQILEASDLTAR
jgi:hypothetical protein